uniref:Uncharacterized protein n=1 Tax=Oryza barthii TaxID=65489 RepID=A0A0D3H304_9ORYZ
MLRRVTLLWSNLLNTSPAPASRSPMQHSNTCNCSSLQTTEFFFRNALEMIDIFGVAICFDKRSIDDSSTEVVISLALLKSLTILSSSLSEKKKRSEEMRRSPPAAGEAATTLPAATPVLEGSPRQDRGGLHQFWRRLYSEQSTTAQGQHKPITYTNGKDQQIL